MVSTCSKRARKLLENERPTPSTNYITDKGEVSSKVKIISIVVLLAIATLTIIFLLPMVWV